MIESLKNTNEDTRKVYSAPDVKQIGVNDVSGGTQPSGSESAGYHS